MPGAVDRAVLLSDERYPLGQSLIRLFAAAGSRERGQSLDAFGHRPNTLAIADDVAACVDHIVNAARARVDAPAIGPGHDRGTSRTLCWQVRDVGVLVPQPVPFVQMSGLD